MRLQKYIAHCGVASRRKAEEIIKDGRVKVNGETIINMGLVIDPSSDIVAVDHKIIKPEENTVYILLNKPEGYITSVSDEFNRSTVIDLVKEIKERIYPVGRLDYDTAGLLIMTNDGDLSFKLTHPKHEVTKTYVAKVKGKLNKGQLSLLRKGVDIGGYITAPASVEILEENDKTSVIKIIIHEGKNRQVRKMFDKVDHHVISLKRIAIGNLKVDGIRKGTWRVLTKTEVMYLKSELC
ncbi:rRNA pseudouridine synthase [Lutibacter sp. B2]|nr:rRNA pseudouridine synthase [Lutibacter sp. B2]